MTAQEEKEWKVPCKELIQLGWICNEGHLCDGCEWELKRREVVKQTRLSVIEEIETAKKIERLRTIEEIEKWIYEQSQKSSAGGISSISINSIRKKLDQLKRGEEGV